MHRSRGINLIHGIIGRLMAPIRSRDQEMSYRDMARITRYMLIRGTDNHRRTIATLNILIWGTENIDGKGTRPLDKEEGPLMTMTPRAEQSLPILLELCILLS
ncbi:hypothetical protein BHM03_00009282 [Ensete ventricosum]|uniref:Uncharacterized protein n=1 Tax=Ensete ventricosum TaxID=4639 RepID=A0A445MCJ8_ENSVE|nr:hypothetical protein BHM03_00009282 [Ensete ventricosum]